jgi:hypothetical protein
VLLGINTLSFQGLYILQEVRKIPFQDRPVAVAAAIASQFAGNGTFVAASPVGDFRLQFSIRLHFNFGSGNDHFVARHLLASH